ncbi:MAG: hypothetical protein Q7S35_10325 [Candidatus Limnocylindrales bacterium]|nr:hypothetical protein [Candidatus Limnocylindrales bacterium]
MVVLGLLGAGAVAFAVFRRRTDEQNAEPITRDDPASSPDPMPWAGNLDDPLLEAMASTAKQRGRRGAIPPGADTPTPIATWVKRLDAEINVLADLAALPAPPTGRETPPPPRAGGRRPRAGDDKSLSA